MRFVPVDSLQIGMILGRDIASSTKSFMLKRGVTLTDAYIKYLQINGYFGAYISDMTSDEVIYDEVVSHETIEKGITAVAEQNIGAIINVSADMVSQISSKSDISVDLFDLRSFDDYTFHHSVNVAVYAAAVGKKMELPPDELSNLVTAALCHDLGKSRVPEEIINKAGKLTDEEFNLIKSHPQFSYDIL
ncbi:MAG: HD domain-containing protein, partial [Lachnospiraceae bacterium]|nr:HD domain-containing protein [Lachnospiraceae bacterium]